MNLMEIRRNTKEIVILEDKLYFKITVKISKIVLRDRWGVKIEAFGFVYAE